jgi:transposase
MHLARAIIESFGRAFGSASIAQGRLKRHWAGILQWFESKINNGVLEGISSLIQAAKAKARGYRSTKNLITIIYLIAGKLDLRLTHLQ